MVAPPVSVRREVGGSFQGQGAASRSIQASWAGRKCAESWGCGEQGCPHASVLVLGMKGGGQGNAVTNGQERWVGR